MGYVNSNLLSGEIVVYRTKLHKIVFVLPSIFVVGFSALAIWLSHQDASFDSYQGLIVALIIVSIYFLLSTFIQYLTSEFAITNKRVIVKTGLIQRNTKETLLRQVEAISVNQSILGRLLNFGNVSIYGTGGTQELFQTIAYPLIFRRSIQEQTEANANINNTR